MCLCVPVCVCERERGGGKEDKKDGTHSPLSHYHPTIVHMHIYTDTLAHAFLLHTTLVWSSVKPKNFPTSKLDSLQSRDQKRTIRRKKRKICPQLCWSKCKRCFFLLLRQKNGINPSPTCFLDFPKHLLCIIHAGPLAN